MADVNKTDANFTGLRYVEEATPGVLPGGTPAWLPLEPNSYGDFGAQITTIARTPITAGRQREFGVVTDLDASASFTLDFTQDNLYDLMQGFFFADWVATPQTSDVDAVDGTNEQYEKAGIQTGVAVGHLIFASGFTNAANNGLKRVDAVASGAIDVVENLVAEASPPTASKVKVVGFWSQGDDDISVDVTGDFPALVSTATDFTDYLDPVADVGRWVFVGGDATTLRFTNAVNNGFARVKTVAAGRLEFDKTQNTMINETSSGTKRLQVFFGDRIKNENDPTDIVRRTYQFERYLSSEDFEYIVGASPNTLTMNVGTADKVTVELGFIANDAQALDTRKTGTFPDIATSGTAFNTSSDFSRIRLANQDALATPLFAFVTELSLSINNNVTPLKAVGVLGAFDQSIGDFAVEGSITAYFTDVAAIQAVRNNERVTLDFVLAKENSAWVFDIPLVALGEGRLNVEKDQAITIPLSANAARDPDLNTTLMSDYFPYVPTLAEG